MFIYLYFVYSCMEEENKCPDCNNTGVVKDSSGVHTCFKCLVSGRLNQHSESVRETKIKL